MENECNGSARRLDKKMLIVIAMSANAAAYACNISWYEIKMWSYNNVKPEIIDDLELQIN